MATTYKTGIVTSTTTGTDGVWYMWMDETTASATTTAQIWTSWTGTGTASITATPGTIPGFTIHNDVPIVPKINKSEFLRKRSGRQYFDNQIKQRQERRESAIRAQLLLKQNLSAIQLAQLKRYGWFFVQGNETGKTYRIRWGRSGNVDVMENGKVLHRLCAHPDIRCPNGDTMLTQKIMLEHCESEFLSKAIRH